MEIEFEKNNYNDDFDEDEYNLEEEKVAHNNKEP